MRKIALDLEFNTRGKIQEIISVGLVVLDENLNVIKEYESYIRLSLTDKLDPFSQKVHKIKKETLENARDFKEVFRELIQILDLQDDDVIMTWGENDKYALVTNAEVHGVEDEFKIFIDKVENIRYSIQQKIRYKGKTFKNVLGLDTARLICNIDQEVSHHALDDARCLAYIYRYAHDKEIISNDKVVSEILAEKKRKKIEKQQRLNTYYNIVDKFAEKYKEGMTLSKLPERSVNQIKAIIKEAKTVSNFKDLSSDKTEILVNKNNYIIKDKLLSKNTTCKIVIYKRQMKIEFNKAGKIYKSELIINKSTVDRVQCLIRVLDSECI